MQNPLQWLLKIDAKARQKRHLDAVRRDPHLARDIGLPDHWVRK